MATGVNVNLHRCVRVHLIPLSVVDQNSADFLNELIAILPDGLATFNRRCTSYTPHENGVTLNFQTDPPTHAEADVIVSSDGIKSHIRGHLFSRLGLDMESQKARYSEWIAWRGMIPRAEFEAAMGKNARAKMMHCGLGRHILHFPVRSGELINIVSTTSAFKL